MSFDKIYLHRIIVTLKCYKFKFSVNFALLRIFDEQMFAV